MQALVQNVVVTKQIGILAGDWESAMCCRNYGKVDSVALCLKSKSGRTVIIIICNQPVSNSLAIWSR